MNGAAQTRSETIIEEKSAGYDDKNLMEQLDISCTVAQLVLS